ncbi:MAG: hypothetical protein ACRDRL_30975, partial [Sciscionella sp.]
MFSLRNTRRFVARPSMLARAAAAIAAAGLMAACADSTGASLASHSQLGFSIGTTPANGVSSALAPQTVGDHTLDLTQATVTIERAELKLAPADVCAGDADDGHGDDNVLSATANADKHGDDDADHDECAEVKV